MTFSMDDYVPVVDRLAQAYERWPELRLFEHPAQVVVIDGQSFVASTVIAHRSPDDSHPAQATAWEPFPGRTSFTKNSEMMNAATSAVGRVLALMGIDADDAVHLQLPDARRASHDASPFRATHTCSSARAGSKTVPVKSP